MNLQRPGLDDGQLPAAGDYRQGQLPFSPDSRPEPLLSGSQVDPASGRHGQAILDQQQTGRRGIFLLGYCRCWNGSHHAGAVRVNDQL